MNPERPHIVFALADDLGFNGVGYRNPTLLTPHIDKLASNGIRLESFYTYRLCGPSRASLLTGRMPYKLEATRTNFIEFWEESGTELSYTMLPEQLRRAGYHTELVGKWHQGFFHPHYLPRHRGFDGFFGMLGGCADHVNQRVCPTACENDKYPGVGRPVDLFRGDDVAYNENGTTRFSHNCLRFGAEAVSVVERFAASPQWRVYRKPLFLFLSLQDPHAPSQTPERLASRYHFDSHLRNVWSGMCSCIDETVDNVTSALKAVRLWSRTLFLFASDNGSPVAGWGAAGSNAPLRGGKATDWEGGVRTPAFVAGGWLPRSRRGVRLDGLVHICDMYATFCALAGAVTANGARGCPRDDGPAAVDSIDLSAYWLNGSPQMASPRHEIVHDISGLVRKGNRSGVIRVGDWKLIAKRYNQATWFGPFSPEPPQNVSAAQRRVQSELQALRIAKGASSAAPLLRRERMEQRRRRAALLQEMAMLKLAAQRHLTAGLRTEDCSLGRPCLFHISTDPEERHDLALQKPDTVERLRALLAERYHAFHLGPKPFGRRGEKQKATVDRWRKGYCNAAYTHGGLMAPWVPSSEPLPTTSWAVRDGVSLAPEA